MTVLAANLAWYYSGGASNSDPALSIGGAKSSVKLSSTAFHNLFDDVTGDQSSSGWEEYRLLYFQTVDPDVNGLAVPILWLTSASVGGYTTMEIGLAAAGKNAVETAIANDYTAPSAVTFSAPEEKSAGIALPSGPYVEDDYIGVWFHRTVAAGAEPEQSQGVAWVLEGETV